MISDETVSGDLADLRKEFAWSGFTFGSIWASAATGPDARRLYASREGMLITSWNAAELRMKIRHELGGE
jgi:hypothetical protein